MIDTIRFLFYSIPEGNPPECLFRFDFGPGRLSGEPFRVRERALKRLCRPERDIVFETARGRTPQARIP